MGSGWKCACMNRIGGLRGLLRRVFRVPRQGVTLRNKIQNVVIEEGRAAGTRLSTPARHCRLPPSLDFTGSSQ